jgi:hypothetical protein
MKDAGTIAKLRGIAAGLRKDDPDREWFTACLAEYESGARHGLTLDAAFGLRLRAGQTSWWDTESCGRRDELLRIIAGKYFPGLGNRAAARSILRETTRYEAAGWRQHRAFKSPPPALAGTLHGALFSLLKVGEPLSEGTARRALAHESPTFGEPRTRTPSAPHST